MLRGRALRISALPVAALTLFSACYRYVPVTEASLEVGGAYRAHLTPEGSQQVAPLLGMDVMHLDGRILSVQDTSYLVSMSATVKREDPRPIVWTGERLTIPRAAVNRLELRQLDRPRTIRAAVLYTAGLLAIGGLVFSVRGLVSGNPGGGGPSPQP
jgi:hypothetical protein